jgi:hypothetical protein
LLQTYFPDILNPKERPIYTRTVVVTPEKAADLSKNSPVLRLRERLLNRPVGTRLHQEIVLALCFAALNAFIEDRIVNQLRVIPGTELIVTGIQTEKKPNPAQMLQTKAAVLAGPKAKAAKA